MDNNDIDGNDNGNYMMIMILIMMREYNDNDI